MRRLHSFLQKWGIPDAVPHKEQPAEEDFFCELQRMVCSDARFFQRNEPVIDIASSHHLCRFLPSVGTDAVGASVMVTRNSSERARMSGVYMA